MNRSLLIASALTVGIALGCIGLPQESSAQIAQQNEAFSMNAVVLKGDPRADGGAFFEADLGDVRLAGEHALNDLGEVVISGFVGNCSNGVYVVSGRTGHRVVDVCHPSPFGRFALFAGANINNQGQVALNIGPVINNVIVDMILLYSDGQLTKVVADGDQSPTGEIFGSFGSSTPIINNRGEIAFSSCFQDAQGTFAGNGVFVYSAGKLRTIAVGHDPSPVGGALVFALVPPPRVFINDGGDVLFNAGQFDPDTTVRERFGLFLATADGMKKIELSGDPMPNGSRAADNSIGSGALNNKGDVVFGLRLSGKPKAGGYVYSGGQLSTFILDGEPSPIGGTFDLLQEVDDPGGPRINDNGTIAVMANVSGGSSPEAIFLASPRAMVKVVGIGDRLPTGEKIRGISSFSLNNLGQVAFFAHGAANLTHPLGVYLVTPNPPRITSIKLKQKKGSVQLRVNGNAMITNDTVIEINGVPIGAIDYPSDSREDGGFTTQVISRDPRLDQLISPGQTIQVTVFNPLTNLRSATMAFTR